MSNYEPSKPIATAHSRAVLRTPTVKPINGYPGNFVVDFGDLNIHCTPEDWNTIDTAVRTGMAS